MIVTALLIAGIYNFGDHNWLSCACLFVSGLFCLCVCWFDWEVSGILRGNTDTDMDTDIQSPSSHS